MGIALVDAVRLAKANKSKYETLTWHHGRIVEQCAEETAAQDQARHDVYTEALAPFRDVFSAIKNVTSPRFGPSNSFVWEISRRGGRACRRSRGSSLRVARRQDLQLRAES